MSPFNNKYYNNRTKYGPAYYVYRLSKRKGDDGKFEDDIPVHRSPRRTATIEDNKSERIAADDLLKNYNAKKNQVQNTTVPQSYTVTGPGQVGDQAFRAQTESEFRNKLQRRKLLTKQPEDEEPSESSPDEDWPSRDDPMIGRF